uniref:Complex 1 LYR protein domain-containing protein n=1 Tax=Ornithodoros turicata TaxID=34597 RepID=A0A2R5L6I9_9ACAR
MVVGRSEVLKLYKLLMRESGRFNSYIYRSYALRRVRDAFRENKAVQEQPEIEKLVREGYENLDIIKRQVLIGSLYKAGNIVVESQFKKT